MLILLPIWLVLLLWRRKEHIYVFILLMTISVSLLRNPVLITSAHLSEELFVGYDLIHKDTERDLAYYVKAEIHYPKIGQIVCFCGRYGEVVSIEEGVGFIMEPIDNIPIYQGMSGSQVTSVTGRLVGIVSGLRGYKQIICSSVE